jgi:YD repeat-containing protein
VGRPYNNYRGVPAEPLYNEIVQIGIGYTYGESHKHAVTLMGSDSFTYDANGNQITRDVGDNSYTLSYDAENRLVSVSGAATATFVYDGDGNRVKGTVNGTTITYVGNYFEWIGSTSTMKKFYYAGSIRLAMRTGSSTLRFLLGDHLGSTSITTDSSGNYQTELRYYPWGERRYADGSIPTTFQYTGQRWDSGIGLYFYGARYYDLIFTDHQAPA